MFRPSPTGTAPTTAVFIIGLSPVASFSTAYTLVPAFGTGIVWRYTAVSALWTCYFDNVAKANTVAGAGTLNAWCSITITRTGTSNFTSTFTIIGGASTSNSGTIANTATALNVLGISWGTSTAGASAVIDFDFIGAEFNSVR